MANLQDLPQEILVWIFYFLGSRSPTTTVVRSKMINNTRPLIPMQHLLLASLVSPTWHTIAYNTFVDIHHVTNPSGSTNEIFRIWERRIRCLLGRIDRWNRNEKPTGRCKCHGQDATWITGWDEIVRRIDKDDPGVRIWRVWVQDIDTARKERVKQVKKERKGPR